MLIELKFRNVASFKDEVSFLMTKVQSFKELLDTNVIPTNRDFDLLKTAAIYGANGAGKSNFISVMATMSHIVHNSFSDSLKKDSEVAGQGFFFRLSTVTENEPSMFEISFLHDNIIYRYGFETLNRVIKSEWLFRKIDREVNLFFREGGIFDINQESFPEGERYKDNVNQNVLFVSYLAQNNQIISKIVHDWFADVNVLNGLNDRNYNAFTAMLLQDDPQFKQWASLALRYLEITNVEAGESEGEIVTYHNKYDENNLLVDSVPFNSKTESAGTSKLIHTLGPIYDTLKLGRRLFIDEFDSKLHPNLSKKLLMLFHGLNRNNAQLIFSAQDSNLLDKELLRRDQIWFVEKDQFGASSLYSLADFDAKTVRNTSAFDKKYLDNQFGAADTMVITDTMLELLYE